MTPDCLHCPCSTPAAAPAAGRLLLSTQVSHTVAALRALARRQGLTARLVAPGLVAVETDGADAFVAAALAELSPVEAAEVRCVALPDGASEAEALRQALAAPTLPAAGARVRHADLLPLFADEAACFSSVYQPIVSLADGRTLGYEALLRARTPAGEAVYPDVLFPAADAAGWTHLLDRIGRTTALHGAGPWLPPDQLLFINFIPTSIYRPEVCLRTTELAAQEAGIRPEQIVFEVTEGHQVQDLDHLERVFDHYRASSCRVALDDLGSGYNSLNMLVRLRPDVVKLDKELVQALPDATSRAVVAAIVDITHSYGGQVLAECVETEEQADVAAALGVDLGQGWLFGRPEPRPEVAAEVRAPRRPRPAAERPAVPVPEQPFRDLAPGAPGDAGVAGLPALLLRAVDGSVSGVVVVDVRAEDHPVLYVNPAFEAMTGYRAAEVLGRNCRFLQGPSTDPGAVRGVREALQRGQEHRTVLRNHRKDGSAWWNELHLSPVVDEDGVLTHYLGYQNDVTARVEAEALLARQATRDGLTGLANRTSLLDGLDRALEDARGAARAVAVLFVDLDGFKPVNDTHGHAAGDAVLVQVAQRLQACLRASDLLCRNGGDEFVAVLPGLDPLDAPRVAERAARDVTAALRRPFVVPGSTASLSGSVGVAVSGRDGDRADRLLAHADAEMYRSKRAAHPAPR